MKFEFVEEIEIEKLTQENAFILNNSSSEDISVFIEALGKKIMEKFFPQLYGIEQNITNSAMEAREELNLNEKKAIEKISNQSSNIDDVI